ncbi:MAG TPA: protein phosphatase 2C domain-containing protein, partial [Chitinophagaceae bacterium]|nr:protein phosphatase 2C domain-containing protein [Chitinophagaceae bacterium]
SDESKVKMKDFIYTTTPDAAKYAHKQVEEFALKQERPLKEFHATLIFAIFKKYEFGYVVLTFGVGDCPIAVLYNDDGTDKLMLMNWLDVGEFGGGTRFITMPEIFTDEKKLHTRVNCKIFKDFSYLMLMTDGIYDPKFVVEASLEKIEKWQEFLKDLDGNNDDQFKVEFNAGNKDIAAQLSKWMEFWSPGNHDDRTLAVVF